MNIIRGLHNLKSAAKNCAITIGNFDGVHLGHQHIFKLLHEQATAEQLHRTVITFEPHPHEYFSSSTAPPRLTLFRDKMQLLQNQPIDQTICLAFNRKLANMPAEDFINEILVQQLQMKYIIVGDDFRFGQQRQGDIDLLNKFSDRQGYCTATAPVLARNGQRISSTHIRQALQAGDLPLTTALLGHPFSITGRVAQGDQRGRHIGFPTANIRLNRHQPAIQGVYIVQVNGLGNDSLQGVANIGQRPTVNGTQQLLEVHLFNFDHEIYGQQINVVFLQQIRAEQRFDSLDALTQQIQTDVTAAKHYFTTLGKSSQ